jgi:hypothetical protein
MQLRLSFSFWILAGTLFAQNMGVNTSSPSATLDVQSQGNSAQTRAVSVSNSNNDTLLLLRDDGRLGIGTTSPAAPLDVNTTGTIAARFSAPVEGQPAVNANELVTLGQLQAVSAGSQGSSSTGSNATMWSSTQTPANVTLFDAMRFCRNLSDGGHTDWRLPHFNDVYTLMSNSAVPLPTLNATGNYWLSATDMTYLNNSSGFWPGVSISNTDLNANGSISFSLIYYYNTYRAFCVR